MNYNFNLHLHTSASNSNFKPQLRLSLAQFSPSLFITISSFLTSDLTFFALILFILFSLTFIFCFKFKYQCHTQSFVFSFDFRFYFKHSNSYFHKWFLQFQLNCHTLPSYFIWFININSNCGWVWPSSALVWFSQFLLRSKSLWVWYP